MVPNGWVTAKLKDVVAGKIKNGYSPNAVDFDTGNWVLGLGALGDDGFIPTEIKSVEMSDKVVAALLRPGDFLISRSNTPEKVGRVARFLGEIESCSYPDLMMRFRVDEKRAEPAFVEYVLRSSPTRLYYKNHAAGSSSSMVKINKATVEKTPLILPGMAEQRKIAKILATWDNAIATTERQIANSQQQNKALMQQLLTGKKRFGMAAEEIEYQKTRYGLIPVDWDYPSIGQVCTQVSQKNTEQADYPVLSCSKHDGFVDSLRYFKKKVYSDDTSGYRVIPYGCFGFPSNHIEEGSIGLQELYDFGIVSPIYVVFQPDESKVNRKFLLALLKTEHYRQIFAASTNASVDRRGSLRWKEFCAIHVPLPSLPEQNKIADALSAADKEIDGFKQQLVHFKQEKQALMQLLLTGKRRVKVDDKEVA